ncbi:MAG: HD domain-containing phosphohydrolase [Roseibium sp.]
MEIVLISDGPLPLDSPVRKLPFFFPARLIDMSRVSPKTVGDAGIAIVELLNSNDAGLSALKASWSSIAEIPVFCLASKNNRREVIQASALGKSEVMERDTPLAMMLKRIKARINQDPMANLPNETSETVKQAYLKADAFLEMLCLSAATEANIHIKAMDASASDLLTAIDLDGLTSWLEAVQCHHSSTYSHSLVVAGIAGAFARYLGWSDADCQEMIAGGLVHDIGKMRIPLTILDKPDRLSNEERALVDKHPVFGQEVLKPRLEVPIDIKKMAIQHHEYLDGSGYPNGLKGSRIGPKVRMMTICDIFTALTEERAYKEALPVRAAISIMKEMGGKLDQKMLAQFAGMVLNRGFGELSRDKAATSGGAAA